MTTTTRKEGFKYGAYMFGYWLALLLFSGVLVAAGSSLIYFEVFDTWALSDLQGEALAVFGGFVAALGIVIFGSGQFGLVYKLVNDAVGTPSPDRGPEQPSAPSESASVYESEPEPEPASEPEAESPSASAPGSASEPASASEPGAAGEEDGTGFGPRSGAPTTTTPAVEQSAGADTASPTASTPDAPDRTPSEREPGATTERTTVGDTDTDTDTDSDSEPAGEPGPSSTAGSAPREGSAPTDRSSDDPSDDPATDEPVLEAGPPRESPEEVASESEIAEELGFKRDEQSGESGMPPADTDEDTDAGDDPLGANSWETGEEKITGQPAEPDESGDGGDTASTDTGDRSDAEPEPVPGETDDES